MDRRDPGAASVWSHHRARAQRRRAAPSGALPHCSPCLLVPLGDNPFTDARDAALFNALRARLTHLDAPGATDAALTAFLRALDTYRPYLAVKDEDYRIVFRGGPIRSVCCGSASAAIRTAACVGRAATT